MSVACNDRMSSPPCIAPIKSVSHPHCLQLPSLNRRSIYSLECSLEKGTLRIDTEDNDSISEPLGEESESVSTKEPRNGITNSMKSSDDGSGASSSGRATMNLYTYTYLDEQP
uniref:Uncharacterized protein n=1 Tax=Lactuca sativa TaxID=4236 RepID=A0A9R1X0A2_LACSA|nr:hypothetical protein LSAT_V11C800422150 [Lactuca sativa]